MDFSRVQNGGSRGRTGGGLGPHLSFTILSSTQRSQLPSEQTQVSGMAGSSGARMRARAARSSASRTAFSQAWYSLSGMAGVAGPIVVVMSASSQQGDPGRALAVA